MIRSNVFIDTGVLKKLICGSNKVGYIENVSRLVEKDHGDPMKCKYVRTALLFLELLGHSEPIPLPNPFHNPREKDLNQYINAVQQSAFKHFASLPILSVSSLEGLGIILAGQNKSPSTFSIALQDFFVNEPLTTAKKSEQTYGIGSHHLSESLAVSWTQRRENYPSILYKTAAVIMFSRYFLNRCSGDDESIYRLANDLYFSLAPEIRKSSEEGRGIARLIDDLRGNAVLKSVRDYVDEEMIHFALVGCWDGTNLSPVHIYTGETNREKFFNRVMIGHLLYDLCRRELTSLGYKPDLPFSPGYVTWIDENGNKAGDSMSISAIIENYQLELVKSKRGNDVSNN